MKDKTVFIFIVSLAFTASACNQNQPTQNSNKAAARQTAANKANDTNGLLQADTDSTQTLSITNTNSNTNSNIRP